MEDVRPPHKVTDYSSSSEESGTTDEEDDDAEQEGAGEPMSGPEDTRAASVLGVFRRESLTESVCPGTGGPLTFLETASVERGRPPVCVHARASPQSPLCSSFFLFNLEVR